MKITEISKHLSTAYVERSEIKVRLDDLNAEIYRCEIALTPPEGWPGKNAETRDLEKARLLAADEKWAAYRAAINHIGQDMTLLNGTIEALETQRRGLEWSIRENLVAVLAYNLRGQQTPSAEAESAMDDQPFDDVSDSLVGDEIFYTAGEELADHETPRELVEAVLEAADHSVDYSEFKGTPLEPTFDMLAPTEEEMPF